MYTDISVWMAALFILGGLAALAWSSDRFVVGAAALARNLGVSPFVVGMVIVGFGTSAPELLVSTFSGLAGHTNLSLGNAYGSCVFNIAGILGVAALVRPLVVKPTIRTVAVPLLLGITAVSSLLLRDGVLSRADAFGLLAAFAVILPVYCKVDKAGGREPDAAEAAPLSTPRALLWTVVGLVVMVGASHLLVWGSVDFAHALGVSDLIIGLTIVAIGTSVPELASAIAAARRNESELVLGNIVGSNIFNMLAVVGIAGAISPSADFSRYVVTRDLPILLAMTALIAVFGRSRAGRRAPGVVSRGEGAVWTAAFVAYMALTIWQEVFQHG